LISQLANKTGYAVRSEYAREYLEGLQRPYTHNDLKVIGEYQEQMSQIIVTRPLLCDTDALTLKVWQDYSFPESEDLIKPIIDKYDMDKRLYLLLEPDIPWVSDPQREHPELIDRVNIYNSTFKLLKQLNCNFICVNGHGEKRLNCALHEI